MPGEGIGRSAQHGFDGIAELLHRRGGRAEEDLEVSAAGRIEVGNGVPSCEASPTMHAYMQ